MERNRQVETNIGQCGSEMHIFYLLFLLTILYYENCVFLTIAPGALSFEIGCWKKSLVSPVLSAVPVLMGTSIQTARLYREYQIVYRVSSTAGTYLPLPTSAN